MQNNERDPLTQLYSWRYFQEQSESLIAMSEKDGITVGLIVLDIDHFKQFNHNFSHVVGDVLLSALATALQGIVANRGMLARIGGSQFAIMAPDITSEDMEQFASDLRRMTALVTVDSDEGVVGPVSLTAGIAIYPDHGKNYLDLLETAKEAVHQGKVKGRNCVAWPPLL